MENLLKEVRRELNLANETAGPLEGSPSEALSPLVTAIGQVATTTTSYDQQQHADLPNFEEIQYNRISLLRSQYMHLVVTGLQAINNIDNNLIEHHLGAYTEHE